MRLIKTPHLFKATGLHAGLMSLCLLAIANYCIIRGILMVQAPGEYFLLPGLVYPNDMAIFIAAGYATLLFGLSYAIIAFHPLYYWPVMFSCGMGYILQIIGIGVSISEGEFSASALVALFFYEPNWLTPPALLLHHLIYIQLLQRMTVSIEE